MAQPFVPGPCPVWVGLQSSAAEVFGTAAAPARGGADKPGPVNPGSANPLFEVPGIGPVPARPAPPQAPAPTGNVAFLGFTQRGVDVEFNPQYSPVVTDAGGRVPSDGIYEGFDATVMVDLTRWNESTYAALADHAAAANVRFAGPRRGSLPAGRIGTIMSLSRSAVVVYVAFPYSAAALYGSMPAGYRFLSCALDRESLPERGSKPARLPLVFRCWRFPAQAALDGNSWPAKGQDLWRIYDHNLSAVAGLLPD